LGFWAAWTNAGVQRNAVQVAAVVGSILNLINQSDVWMHAAAISWPHLVMNFMVPYCVASFSGARMKAAQGGP
jgi:hypothetical protein